MVTFQRMSGYVQSHKYLRTPRLEHQLTREANAIIYDLEEFEDGNLRISPSDMRANSGFRRNEVWLAGYNMIAYPPRYLDSRIFKAR